MLLIGQLVDGNGGQAVSADGHIIEGYAVWASGILADFRAIRIKKDVADRAIEIGGVGSDI